MYAILFLLLSGTAAKDSLNLKRDEEQWVTTNCPTNWTVSQVTHKCYNVFNEEASFDVASAKCRSYDAALVSIHSAFESTEIFAAARRMNPSGRPMWIGLFNSPAFAWAWEDGTPIDYTAWKAGNPVQPYTATCACYSDFAANTALWNNQYPCENRAIYACIKEHAINCQDVLFVLDRSNSINVNDYNTNVRNFIINYSRHLLFTESDQVIFSRIGVIEFDNKEVYTIPMIGRSRTDFETAVKLLIHRQKPESRTADALSMAIRILRRNRRPEHGMTVVFIADGKHNIGNDPIPYTVELRDLGASFFVVALNGSSLSLDGDAQQELRAMVGGIPGRYLSMGSPTFNDPHTAENLAFASGCPAAPNKVCRAILFLFEETKESLPTAKVMLNSLNITAAAFSAQTALQIVLYSDGGHSRVVGEAGDKLVEFQKNIDYLIKTVSAINAVSTYLAEGLGTMASLIEEYKSKNEFSSIFVVVVGQAGAGKVADKSSLSTAAQKLLDLTSTVYVADVSRNGMDFSIWPMVVGESHTSRVRQYGFVNDSNVIAAGIQQQLSADFNAIVCPP